MKKINVRSMFVGLLVVLSLLLSGCSWGEKTLDTFQQANGTVTCSTVMDFGKGQLVEVCK